MFCTACGAAAQAGQRFCSQCGQSIDGASTPKHTNRVRDHLRILGILWMVYSIVIFLSGAALFVITKTALGHYGTFGEGMPHPHFLRPLMSLIAFFVTAKGLAGMAAGWGLLQRAPWARGITLVLAFLSLLNLPFGTALGIYSIWVLLSRDADRQYRSLSYAG